MTNCKDGNNENSQCAKAYNTKENAHRCITDNCSITSRLPAHNHDALTHLCTLRISTLATFKNVIASKHFIFPMHRVLESKTNTKEATQLQTSMRKTFKHQGEIASLHH